MPTIGKPAIVKVNLVTAGAWVTLLTNPPKEAFATDGTNPEQSGTNLLLSTIKEWNFTNEDGTPAPITKETIETALSNFDIMKISAALGLSDIMLSEAKKNS